MGCLRVCVFMCACGLGICPGVRKKPRCLKIINVFGAGKQHLKTHQEATNIYIQAQKNKHQHTCNIFASILHTSKIATQLQQHKMQQNCDGNATQCKQQKLQHNCNEIATKCQHNCNIMLQNIFHMCGNGGRTRLTKEGGNGGMTREEVVEQTRVPGSHTRPSPFECISRRAGFISLCP